MLYVAAILLVALGAAHSYLGERYILIRLFRLPNLPKLFGTTQFTTNTLRFAWHLTTLTWLGIAALLWQLAGRTLTPQSTAETIGLMAIASGILPMAFTGGRHLSWVILFSVGVLALWWAIA